MRGASPRAPPLRALEGGVVLRQSSVARGLHHGWQPRFPTQSVVEAGGRQPIPERVPVRVVPQAVGRRLPVASPMLFVAGLEAGVEIDHADIRVLQQRAHPREGGLRGKEHHEELGTALLHLLLPAPDQPPEHLGAMV